MRFLIKNSFKEPPTEEVQALIPAELARTKELAEQGISEAMYVAADRSGAWEVWNCGSEEALKEIKKTLPLHKYLNIEITLLQDDF
jgi:muconolactone delta-isomerase